MYETVWDEMIEIKLTGQWKTIRAAVPHIIRGGRGGSVVITSSLAAIYANENTAHYSAAKAGLVMLMNVLAMARRMRANTSLSSLRTRAKARSAASRKTTVRLTR